MAGGRPMKFSSVEELQQKIDLFWEDVDEGKIKPTVSRLAVYLDTSRATLINYEAKEEYFNTIKKAKDRIEAEYEDRLIEGKATAGVIFALVNNSGWVNKQETKINHSGKVHYDSIGFESDD